MKLIKCLTSVVVSTVSTPTLASPNLATPGVPSAFTAEWGDYYAWTAGYAFEDIVFDDKRQRLEKNGIDGDAAIGVGLGLGSADNLVAIEVGVGTTGFQSQYSGGVLDLRAGRNLVNNNNFRLGIGGGILNAASWGNEDKDAAVYGVATAGAVLGDRPLQISIGVGNGDERASGLFAGIGVGITKNLGMSAGWDGRSLNAAVSLKPKPNSQWNYALNGINLTDDGGRGRAVVFSVSYGASFRSFSPIN